MGSTGNISKPTQDLLLYSDGATGLYSGEWFTLAVCRFEATDAEAAAIAAYIADPTADLDGYLPTLP